MENLVRACDANEDVEIIFHLYRGDRIEEEKKFYIKKMNDNHFDFQEKKMVWMVGISMEAHIYARTVTLKESLGYVFRAIKGTPELRLRKVGVHNNTTLQSLEYEHGIRYDGEFNQLPSDDKMCTLITKMIHFLY